MTRRRPLAWIGDTLGAAALFAAMFCALWLTDVQPSGLYVAETTSSVGMLK